MLRLCEGEEGLRFVRGKGMDMQHSPSDPEPRAGEARGRLNLDRRGDGPLAPSIAG